MEKIRVALILTGFEELADFHLIESLKEHLSSAPNFEFKVIEINHKEIQKTVEEIQQYRPIFTIEFNTKGVIWGQNNQEKKTLHDIMGFVNISIMTQDPIINAPNILELKRTNTINSLFVITDLRYGEFLARLGFQNIFFIAPCANENLAPKEEKEKDINVLFIGDAIDPNELIKKWSNAMDPVLKDFLVEVGEFCFRNPEITPLYAVDYLLSLMNPQFQEAFNKMRNEQPQAYYQFLFQTGIYTNLRRNWFILNYLEGIEGLVIAGITEGNLPEGFQVAQITNIKEKLEYIKRAKLVLTTFPTFVPSSIGFTPLEAAMLKTPTMINYRHTLPSFFKPNEEIIAFNPLDRLDIEEKLLFYLENEKDREIIGENAYKAFDQKFRCNDRIEFLKNLMIDIYNKAKNSPPPQPSSQQSLNNPGRRPPSVN